MRILRMTATFGKLNQKTLELKPGLNIIEAPNEWGKSTWCAFLTAMLYGIETGSRSKTGFLADKEHYAPWSGESMSGSMDILWNGREITLQRRGKGRVPLGEVKAFETQTGIAVPELEIACPGQVLLGVERSVFARAGFLRQSEMPVTEDEALRRRLNELVTTGDESGASDDLAQRLRDLKNRCRFNKKGLLPEVEARQAELEQKLQQVHALEHQVLAITQNQNALKEQCRLLENHRQALEYAAYLQHAKKLADARIQRDSAAEALRRTEQLCQGTDAPEELQQKLTRLQRLREEKDSLHMQAQSLPSQPESPLCPEPFRGKALRQVVDDARLDAKVLTQLRNDLSKPVPYIVSGICLVLGLIFLLLAPKPLAQAGAGLVLLSGVGSLFTGIRKQKKLKRQIRELLEQYRGMPEDSWETAAEAYFQQMLEYEELSAVRQREAEDVNRLLEENATAFHKLTEGKSPAEFEQVCRQQLFDHSRLEEQRRALQQAEAMLQMLSDGEKSVLPPEAEDTLTLTPEQTAAQISQLAVEQQKLQRMLGQCQGQMETLGNPETLQERLELLRQRKEALEQYYRALTLAQETVQQATRELQRRFAPRISKRAQELFARLTDQRYRKLILDQDLSVQAEAEGENTLRGTLWRSDGTVDQLYLALRLAVAEVLTPEAPLVLDDALVRFDDVRLTAALEILRETAEQKQVILFTCQTREKRWEETA